MTKHSPDEENDRPPGEGLAARVDSVLAKEYRVPFRTIVVAALGLFGFLFTYSEVVKWVRDQVRAERVVIDIRRDEESATQNKLLAAHEARIAQLEAQHAALTNSIASLGGDLRALRAEVGTVHELLIRNQRDSKTRERK